MKEQANHKIPWTELGLVYLVHQFIVYTSCYFGQNMLVGKKGSLEWTAALLRGMSHWDGRWYLRIATEGYTLKSAAFFPLYPFLIKYLSSLGLPPDLSALVIANLALALLLLCFERLLSLDYPVPIRLRALWYLALFPTSFFFSVMYTEALFLCLVLLVFYCARKQQWLLASLAGMLAALTRSLGVLLILPLLYELYRAYFQKAEPLITPAPTSITRKPWLSLFSFLMVPGGLGLYMLYLQQNLGSPWVFMTAQRFWKRSFDWPWHSIYRAILEPGNGRNLTNLGFTLLALGLLFLYWRKLRPSYILYMLSGLVVPLCSPSLHSPLLSMPRFVLVLFPLYLILAIQVQREQRIWAVLCCFTTGLIYLNMLFSNSRWVA